MNKLFNILVLLSVIASLTTSCSVTKSLKPGQKLYIGSDVDLKRYDSSKIVNKELQEELKSLIRPRPNSRVLGVPYKLMIYNAIGEPKKKDGFWARMRNKYGEAPVVISDAALEKNRQILGNRLENRGYFKNTVLLDSVVKDKKLKAKYTALLGEQYTFREYNFENDSSQIGNDIRDVAKRMPERRKGNAYSLETITRDRERIDDRLKQRGYYYFNPDYLLAFVDSTVGNHQVDVDVKIKPSTPEKALQQYRIRDIYVFTNYDIKTDTTYYIDAARLNSMNNTDTAQHLHIIDPERNFRTVVFDRTLGFKPGDLYNRSAHSLALNRLTNLGTFKFVRANFQEVDTVSTGGNWLNTFYFLTPAQKKSIRFEVSGFVKSNNSNGAELSVNWRHRNLLKGAEKFTARAYGSVEQQVMKGIKNIGTRKIGGEMSLEIPRLLGRFSWDTSNAFLPKTLISAGYERFIRTDQYSLNSFNANYAYIWKPTVNKEHKLDVVNFVYVRPSNIDSNFQKRLDTSVILRRSLEQQFILGSIHNFTYNTQALPNRRRHNFYLNTNLDVAGNILGLATGANIREDKEKHIFKTPFSQYIRGEVDFRHYLRFSNTLNLASRAIVGAGYAYGNSYTLPFVKSFFAGGPNDIRAFMIRSLGPGSYYAGNPRLNRIYVGDQPGEMKIEFNTEIRKKFANIFEFAFFIDAGNTWLLREDSTRPGGKISSNFLKEFAIGAGPGIRLDLSILLLRLDVGIPVRGPVHGENRFDWHFKRMEWEWLKNNWVWNISIGYPF